MNMAKWTMFAIFNSNEDLWFNVALDGWVDPFELEGDCLFPTSEMAQKYIDDVVQDNSAKVYRIEIPVREIVYDYSPVTEE